MLLETRGDYEFANGLRHVLRDLADEVKRSNDLKEKQEQERGRYSDLRKVAEKYAEMDITDDTSDELNAICADCNNLIKYLDRLETSKESENWDITWANIIDSMINTGSDADSPRFWVGKDDEILCKTEDDANCIADFLVALGFDGVCTAENPENRYRWGIHPNS